MGRRIMIVEDQEDNRRILRDLLTSVGCDLVEAVDGDSALGIAQDGRPELILMDIHLPGLDGYQVTRQMRADPDLRAVPIIAITSYALSGDEAKAKAAGCDAYIAKPFRPRDVLAKIRQFITI
jgi:two-component system cell cycle response regulator DivK